MKIQFRRLRNTFAALLFVLGVCTSSLSAVEPEAPENWFGDKAKTRVLNDEQIAMFKEFAEGNSGLPEKVREDLAQLGARIATPVNLTESEQAAVSNCIKTNSHYIIMQGLHAGSAKKSVVYSFGFARIGRTKIGVVEFVSRNEHFGFDMIETSPSQWYIFGNSLSRRVDATLRSPVPFRIDNAFNTDRVAKHRKIGKDEFLEVRTTAVSNTQISLQLKSTFEGITPDEIEEVDLSMDEIKELSGLMTEGPRGLFASDKGEVVRFALGKARGIQFGLIEVRSTVDRRHYDWYVVKERAKWQCFATGEFKLHRE